MQNHKTWKLKKVGGLVVVDEPSNDTCSTVQEQGPIYVRAARQAVAVIRQEPSISRARLVELLPDLANCPDRHVECLFESDRLAPREWMLDVLSDTTGYSRDTIERYYKTKGSRQFKQSRRGRPTKK